MEKRKLFLLPLAVLFFFACEEEPVPFVDPDPTSVPDTLDTGKYSYLMYGLAEIDILTDGKAAVDSKDPADYRPCSISVNGGEVFDNYEGRGVIRGRGNSTWEWYPKKPYRIKLDETSPFMGMSSNRDWVLLADYRDVTHMMNNVGFSMAHWLNIPYTNHSRYATVTLNGQDMGLYMVTEQVEHGGHRVDVEAAGGILLALDINDGPGDAPWETNNFYSKNIHMDCAVKWPDNPDEATVNWVREEFAALEEAILDEDWKRIDALLDVKSMIDYLIVEEAIGNVELDNGNSCRSVYINRKLGGKWTMGPVWDCDGGFSYNWGDMYDYWGWGHTYFENDTYLVMGSQPYTGQGAYGAGISPFFSRLFGIKEFVQMFKARWEETREDMLDYVLANIDATYEVIADRVRADCSLWGIRNYSPAEQVFNLKRWLSNRFDYLDVVVAGYKEYGGGKPDNPEPAEEPTTLNVKHSAVVNASFRQDWTHHEGVTVSPSVFSDADVREALGCSLDEIPDKVADGTLLLAAVAPDGTPRYGTTASDSKGVGFWFNPEGQVTTYGNESAVYVELSFYRWEFILGKHPVLCMPGDYRFSIAFVVPSSGDAVQIDFSVTVTD